MAKHIVTCRVCKKTFDTNDENEKWVMPSPRYYFHEQCYNDWKHNTDNATDEDWVILIYDFIARDLKGEYNYWSCEQLRKKYIRENKFTNKGIYFTLKYFYEVKKNPWSKANGSLGIVPYVYKDATEYWTDLEWKKRGFMKAIEEQIFERANRDVIRFKRPTINKKKEKYNLDNIEGAEENDS